MSRTIDEKIVEMRFDNSDFEKNVKTSMSTLDKLKAALNFKGAKKGIEEVAEASEKLDFRATADGIQKVQYKFNAMYALTSKIFDKLTDKAFALVKSMSFDQAAAGMKKYQEKVTSVQTIMSATGRSIEEVTEQLEILNWFSDETSYSFTDMASNVGKFTAAGVKLEDAVNAMQGIANWAAISGQNAQAASRAMYNLSQSMGVGYVNLMDWKSIENANMGTLAFKEAALDTAAALGVLVKVGKDANGVMQYFNQATQETYNALNFRESLSDKWFTKDVLNVVLNQYGAYASAIKMVQDRMDVEATASQTMQILDQFIKQKDIDSSVESMEKLADRFHLNIEEATALYDTYNSIGKSAFEAAQQAKTWTDVVDATRDAVSSSWMRAFETIFGDYQDAKILFTDMANEMWNIFAGPVDALATNLSEAMNHKTAWDTITDFLGAEDIGKTAEDWEKAIMKVAKANDYIYGTTIDMDKNSETYGKEIAAHYNLEELVNRFGSLEKVTERGFLTMQDYENALRELGVEFNLTEEDARSFEEALYALTEKGGRVKLIESLGHLYNVIKDVFTAIKTAFTNVFSTSMSERVTRFIDGFHDLAMSLELTKETGSKITKTFEGIFKGLRTGLTILSNVSKAVMSVIGFIAPYVTKAFTFVFGVVSDRIGGLSDIFDKVAEYLSTKFEEISEAIANSKTLQKLKEGFGVIKSYVMDVWDTIVQTVGSVNAGVIIDFFDTLGGVVMGFAATVMQSDIVTNGISAVTTVIKTLGGAIRNFKLPSLQQVSEAIATFATNFAATAPAKLGDLGTRIKEFVTTKTSLYIGKLFESIGQAYANSKGYLAKAIDWLIRIVRKIADFLSEFVSFSFQSIFVATKKLLQLAQMFAVFKLLISASKFLDSVRHKFEGDRAGGIEGVLAQVVNVVKRLGIFAAEMAAVIYIFGKMPQDVLAQGLQTMGFILGGLLAVIFSTLGLSHGLTEKDIMGCAALIGALGLAVKLIADALLVLNDIQFNLGGLLALGVVLGGFYFFIKSLSALGPDAVKGALPLLALASGLKMFLSVIEEYTKFNWSRNAKGIIMLVPMMIAMIAVIKSMSGVEKLNSLAFVGMAVALKLMVSIIEDLGSLPAGILVKGAATLWAIASILKIFTSIVTELGSGTDLVDKKAVKNSLINFVGVIALLLAVVAAVVILGKMPTDQLVKGGSAVTALLGMISLVLFSLSKLSTVGTGKILVTLGSIVLVVAALAAIYKYLLADTDYSTALEALMVLTAMVAEIVVLAATAALLGIVGNGTIDRGIAALAKITLFLGVLLAVVDTIVYEIAQKDGIEEGLEKAVHVATLLGDVLGSLIGGFFGGIRGSAAEAYASHMPKIAEYLADFGNKIGGFINFVTTVGNEGKTTTMSMFMDSITALVTGLVKISKKDKDLKLLPSIAYKLREFMMNLIQNGYFFSGLDNVNAAQIEAAGTIAKIIEALMPIARGQGLKSLWTGAASPGKLADNLNGYSTAIINFGKNLKDAEFSKDIEDKVEIFGSISKSVIKMFTELPNSTGIVESVLGGGKSWKTIGNNFGWFRGVIDGFVNELNKKDIYNDAAKKKAKAWGEVVGTVIEAFNKIGVSNGLSLGINGLEIVTEKDWKTVGEGLNDFVTAIKKFINGITDIDTSQDYGVIGQTVTNIIDSINATIEGSADKLNFTGTVLGDHLLGGMSEALSVADDKITYFVSGFQSSFGNYYDHFEVLGKNAAGRLNKGLKDSLEDAKKTGIKLAIAINTALRLGYGDETSLWAKMYAVGKHAADGLYDGMTSWYAENLVKNAGTRLGKLAFEAAKRSIEAHSPSKKFMELGTWTAEGYSLGVTNSLGMVANAMDRMGDTSLDSLRTAMSSLSTDIESDNYAPVIRPVLDLSDVDNGLNGLRSGNYSLGVGATTRNLTNSIKIQNGGNTVAGAISSLKEDLNTMKNEMLGMRIVMDSGALVGSISTKMDGALGTIATYKGRGNI